MSITAALQSLRQPLALAGLAVLVTCGGRPAPPQPTPSVVTGEADGLTPHAVVLHGQATGNGTSGSASFRFGGDPALTRAFDRWPYLDFPGVGVGAPVGYPAGGPAVSYQSSLTGLVPGWTYYYQAVAQTLDYLVSRGEIRTFTTPATVEPTWFRVLLGGGTPALVGLGTGFAVRGGSWGSPTWTAAFDGEGHLQWQGLGAAGDEATPQVRSTGTGLLTVSRARKVPLPTPMDWTSAISRVDATGKVTWQQNLSGWLGPGGPTADGGAQVLGDLGQGLVWVRLTASGGVAWARANDSGQDPLALLELEGGALACVGRSVRIGGTHDGIPVEVRTASGTLAWRRILWRADGERAEAVEPVPGGGLVLAGVTWAGPLDEPLVAGLGPDGALIWAVRLVGERGSATGLAATGDGGWLVSGAGVLAGDGTRYAWVARLDAVGQCLWGTRFYGRFQLPVRVLARPGGGFVLAGYIESGYNTYGTGIVLTDGSRRAGGAGVDLSYAGTPVAITADVPAWADRSVVFPAFSAGAAPLRATNLTAVQLAP